MKPQLLKATAFALLQAALPVHSHEDAAVMQNRIKDVAVVADKCNSNCNDDLNCCLDDCDCDFGGQTSKWKACRAVCEDDYGNNRNTRNSGRNNGRNNGRNDRAPSYCNFREDYDCYPRDGVPACCNKNGGRDCPLTVPSCAGSSRGQRGDDYCKWDKDSRCYEDGWPKCCMRNSGKNCPSQQPDCDRKGGSNNDRNNNRNDGPSYCNARTDFDCYPIDGVPVCCSQNRGRDCPNRKPDCAGTRNGRIGSDYCNWPKDKKCYKDGWPRCCSKNNGRDCPSQQPRCDTGVDGEDNEEKGRFDGEEGTPVPPKFNMVTNKASMEKYRASLRKGRRDMGKEKSKVRIKVDVDEPVED